MSISDNWRNADPLNVAWFMYGAPEMKEHYRNSGAMPEAAGLSLQLEMRWELRDRIANGDIIALGISIPVLENGEPQIIPPTFFAASSVELDWDNDTVLGLGRSFADVCVCLSAPIPTNPVAPPFEQEVQPHNTSTNGTKRGGGRRNLYPLAKTVLDELFLDPALANMAAERLLDPFNRIYVTRYSTPDRKAPAVSERALRNYLKRYRQELADTGNN